MKVLIDATNQRAGGGLQVAITTIAGLADACSSRHQLSVLALRDSSVARVARERHLELYTCGSGVAGRIYRHTRGAPRVLAKVTPDVVYTIFGPPLPTGGRSLSVAGVAYANLFYPEVRFWRHIGPLGGVLKKVKDSARLSRVLQADGLVFETTAIRDRAVSRFGMLKSRTAVIPPCAASSIKEPRTDATVERLLASLPPRPRVLLATSANPNKNLHMLPSVARELGLRWEGHSCPIFLVTLDPQSRAAKKLRRAALAMGVTQHIRFIGTISQDSIGFVYRHSDLVLLISELESFSNNVLEAFEAERPLVISDREWAHSACSDAAIYVDPGDPRSIRDGVERALEPKVAKAKVGKGLERLKERHQAPAARAGRILDFLESIQAIGSTDK